MEWEQAPRGTVTLKAERDGAAVEATLPPGQWGLTVRPVLSASNLEVYRQGQALVDAKKKAEGVALWQKVAESEEVSGRPGVAV